MAHQELDLRGLLRVFRRRLWILLIIPLVCAELAALVSFYVLQPVYQTSTTILVIKRNPMDGIGPVTYVGVAQTLVVDKVVEQLGPGISAGALRSKLSVSPVRDSELLMFTIQDSDPQRAVLLANAVVAAFTEEIAKLTKIDRVMVVQPAGVPWFPIEPRPTVNIALGLAAGFMASVGAVVLLEYLDTSIKSPEDLQHYVGIAILGVIPVHEREKIKESGEVLSDSLSAKIDLVVDK